jgi:hypothetical protein
MPDFTAREPTLGYLYQARYALLLLLTGVEEQELLLETLDDIVLEQSGTPRELLQTKHHVTSEARLTDASPELWKTLRVWSTMLSEGKIQIPPTQLTLVTTAQAPDTSIAAALRPGVKRDAEALRLALKNIAAQSKNEQLQAAFEAFTALREDQQISLVENIYVLDSSPNISDTADRIRDRIRGAVARQHREALFERLEGWWFGKIVEQLRTSPPPAISGFEVYDKINFLAEQFRPDALPIDFLDAEPDNLDASTDDRLFVQQLRAVKVKQTRIEKAILDYYRAFEQRSRWAREELLVGGEVQSYERRLIDEWERFSAAATEDLPHDAKSDALERVGRAIFNWMEQTADLRIRPNVTEPYVMRGSYHDLANRPTPTVWWHPQFFEHLAEVVADVGEEIR